LPTESRHGTHGGSGVYHSPEEVIERALEVLRAEDEWLAQNEEAINQKIERGIAQLDRGEGISGEELRARLEERKAAWLAEQQPR
jgi:Arc/MetJ-type ribon-helix-helix transcriptional regulator